MADIVGGCLCGRIRYRSTAAALFTAVCHCTHCQKTSGSAFSVVLGLPRDSLVFEGAPMSSYRDAGDSGLPIDRKFCPTCGSPLVSEAAAAPALAFLKAGTLDDTSGVKPQMDIWCDQAQPWVPPNEGAARIARNPPLG